METNYEVLAVNYEGSHAYDIQIRESFEALSQCVASLDTADRRICIVTDSNTGPLYAEAVMQQIRPICREVFLFTLPAGEEHKTLDQIREIYAFLIQHEFDRQDLLIALGGGVVGDMTGFAAATYLRGIRFIQIPTTLLAQVDSSIGGKTGVDFGDFKNMVGAFHMPSLVYIAADTLKTLPELQFESGMGEVLKHGLIRDASYYEWTIENMMEICERQTQYLMTMIKGSCRIKRAVVEKDPKEKGERALLNFGHTLGHAIETAMQFRLPHGHCVALGCVAAAHISWKRGLLDEGEFYEIRDMMVGFGLPISYDGIDSGEILRIARHDKKASAGKIRFILLKKIGSAFIDLTVTEEEMKAALDSLNADLW